MSEQLRGAQGYGLLPADDVPPIHFHYILAGSVTFIFHQAEECKRLSGIDPFDEAIDREPHARTRARVLRAASSDGVDSIAKPTRSAFDEEPRPHPFRIGGTSDERDRTASGCWQSARSAW